MMPAARLACAGAIGAVLAACVSLGQQELQRHYVLEPAGGDKPSKPAVAREATLLVAPMTAAAFYDTPEIVYSRAPGERAYYQLSTWTERPGRRMTDLLIARLERAGSFTTVARAASGVQGNLVLNAHLAAFYHDAATPPGQVRVFVTAELVDTTRRSLLARRAFERSANAPTHDAAGAVAAFNQATAQILDDIVAWVDGTSPR
ncbi:MAG: ABC-type transport auxiliary lipoprotein family protein [Betaproteobacteria bacterium]